MKSEQRFNVRRCFLLMRNDLFMSRFLLLISAGVAVALLVLIYSRGAARGLDPVFDGVFWIIGLYFFGWLVGDRLFSNIHDGDKNLIWHLLPASLAEKYSSRLMLSSLGFTVAWTLFFCAVSFISGLTTQLLYGRGHGVLNVLDSNLIREAYRFLILQSIGIFGVIYFKKNAAIKTALTLLIYIFLIMLTIIVVFNLIFRDYTNGLIFGFRINANAFSFGTDIHRNMMPFFEGSAARKLAGMADVIGRVVFWYLLMPFFWGMGYIRLKEKEV